jgi:cytidine deaminase
VAEAPATALIDAARAAAANAYAPYSNFAVGAAVLLADGAIIAGANFENASYGLSLCAETAALAAANTAGRLRDVVAIGVVGGVAGSDGHLGGTVPVRPCGRCRQVLNETAQLGGRDILVHCASADGSIIERHLISDLLPHAFGPADLGRR